MLDGRPAWPKASLDPPRRALFQQHCDDLPRGSVAEELAERLFVPGDPVPIDQGDEIRRRVTAERGLGEMRVGGQEVVGARHGDW